MTKHKDEQFEKNISRLVKLANDSDKPSEKFQKSLTDEALKKLEQSTAKQQRDRRDTIMTAKRIFALAASVVIVAGILAAILTPHLQKAQRYSKDMSQSENRSAHRQFNEKSDSGRDATSRPREIVYTQNDEKKVVSPVTETPRVSDDLYAFDRAKEEAEKLNYAQRGKEPLMADKVTELGLIEIEAVKQRAMKEAAEAKAGKPALKLNCRMPDEPGAGGYPPAHGGTRPPNDEDVDAQFFKNYGVNPFVDTEDDHLSTFATDVDTGSYTIVRKYLHDGLLPPESAVRVEEFVNYFKYNYEAPQKDDFAVYAEACPWQFGEARKNSHLLRLGLKAKQITEENRKPAILTFVIDVSGSMERENRLGLVKRSLQMLVRNLRPDDKIGIAVYGSSGRKVMSHKGLDEKDEITSVIEKLSASGSTYAEQGIRIGYEMAEEALEKGKINRVILCSDGVANVGRTGAEAILEVIKKKAEKGITLSAIGFGMGNYNDVLMEQLGDKGNGYYAYVDSIAEAKKLFEENLTGTLQVVARDVKVQVDFNPKVVRSYRLIGYENRDVPDEKFRDDKYDGGEIGAGHSVTALYELKLWPEKEGTVATTYVRYKDADTFAVTEFKSTIETDDVQKSIDDCSGNFRLAATAAEFAEILRKSYWAKGATLGPVLERAQKLTDDFAGDADVIEVFDLISKANKLMKPAENTENAEEIEYLMEENH